MADSGRGKSRLHSELHEAKITENIGWHMVRCRSGLFPRVHLRFRRICEKEVTEQTQPNSVVPDNFICDYSAISYSVQKQDHFF